MATAATEPAASTVSRLSRPGVWLALLIALSALGLLAISPIGWRARWWHYEFAFRSLMPWAFYCGVVGAGLGLVTVAFGSSGLARRHFMIALAAIVIGAVTAAVPWHYKQMLSKYPRINDITTDWTNPPQFVAAVPLRAAGHGNSVVYGGAAVAAQQRKAYPDIAPLIAAQAPPQAFATALATARKMGWTIIASDPKSGHIEATDRSRWFRFADDIVVRVEPQGGGSRIDVRSSARHGSGDFGVNAARVHAYLTALRHAGLGG
ncbi:MAG TPA: DUF1499 domain-containing protein [Stellaceae bacterium]|nr:DUF1499 domain-containing protein [Stellaceae bacterium]